MESNLCCAVCGACDDSAVVHVNETWSGKWQSACCHAACEVCLRQRIVEELPRCQEEQQLRVQCYAPGCRKMLPQQLVYHAVTGSGLAATVDWFEHIQQPENALNIEVRGDQCSMKIDVRGQRCIICNDSVGLLVELDQCGHVACEPCWGKWFNTQILRCSTAKNLNNFRCYGPACETLVPLKLALAASSQVRELKKDLAVRERLRHNKLYPAEVQVNCPCVGCVGLGYLGFDTVMCFICEHQWSVEGEVPDADLPGTVKQCPQCKAQIEKDGGCDHMTCRCGHEFYWSTGNPFRV